MIVTLNEIETTCYRAALGVGLQQGLAEDAGRIAVKLACRHAGALHIMLRALRTAEASPVTPPVFIRKDDAWAPSRPSLPALFAAPIAMELCLAEPGVTVGLGAIDEPAILAACGEGDPLPPDHPLEADIETWRELARLASRTYVPASATSRNSGAGAGMIDND